MGIEGSSSEHQQIAEGHTHQSVDEVIFLTASDMKAGETVHIYQNQQSPEERTSDDWPELEFFDGVGFYEDVYGALEGNPAREVIRGNRQGRKNGKLNNYRRNNPNR